MIKHKIKFNENTPLLYDKESIPISSSTSTTSSTSSTTTPAPFCQIVNSPTPCTITLLLSTFLPSLSGFLCGYDQTVMKSLLALPNFQHHYVNGNLLIAGFNPFDYITSGYYTTAIFGSLYGGYICDHAGRKRSLVGAFLLFALGTFLGIASTHSLAFLTSRLIIGFCSGILLVASVCMITELAPVAYRGCFVGFVALLNMAGQLAGYYMMSGIQPWISASMSSSSATSKSSLILHYSSWSYGWQTPIVVGLCICLFTAWAQRRLPESPRWLTWSSQHHNGRMDITNDGLNVLACLYECPLNDPMIQQLWKQIIDGCDSTATYASETRQRYMDYLLLLVGSDRRHSKSMQQPELFYYQQQRKRRLLLACGLILANGMTGCDMLVKNYASAIFYASGLHEASILATNGCTSSMALAVMAISLGWCVDYFERKTLLLIGGIVMVLCHLGLGSIFQWFSVVDWQTGSVLLIDAHARMMAIVLVYVFIIIYSFTWASVTLITICECFSMCDRAKGMALVACLAWSSQWCLVMFSRSFFMSSLIYYIFGVSSLLSCYLIYRLVPNTTGKSLEEISGLLL